MATKKSRKNPRAQVSLLARYRSPTAFEYVNEECFDLSAGGMFIKSPAPAPTGTLLKLECAVNGGAEMLRGVARVVWLREIESDGQPSGMGVKFVKLEQGSREIIHRILVERGSIEPGELEALRPSVAPTAVLEARAGSAGGAVGALAARSATLPPEMRATVPDGSLLRQPREVEDVTDEVTSAQSDPPASSSSAPPARASTNGAAAHAGAKPVAATPMTGTRPSAGATRPTAPAKQRTGIVVVLVLVAAAAAAAIVVSRPAPAPEPSPAVTVSVPIPEPAAIEPATPQPSVLAPEPPTESASAEPAVPAPRAASEPAPARPVAREPERAAAASRTPPPAQPRAAEPAAEPETEPAPTSEPVLVATGSTSAPVALTAEGAPLAAAPQPAPTRAAPSPTPAPAAYVLTVVTTPAGAQVSTAGQAGISPCRFELGALEAKVEVQANLAGYSPAVAVIDRIGFMLDDGRMRRRISLTLHEVPKAMPDPEPVATKPSRHRSREAREPEIESEPKPAVKAPSGTPMQAAMTCLTTGDNACAVQALEGKARNAQELELLIETYRTLGNSAKAEHWMNAYVEKYPAERRANTYRRQLERRQSEAQ